MRTLVHLSDLNFGKLEPQVLEALPALVHRLQPDLVAVAGNLTYRATVPEFTAAKEFLDSLPSPQVVVPGNHDIPAFHLSERLFTPLQRFQKYISSDLRPCFADRELIVAGVDTANIFGSAKGSLSRDQAGTLRTHLDTAAPGAARVLVSNHPFVLTPYAGRKGATDISFDIFLAGKFSRGVKELASRFGGRCLYVRAGAADADEDFSFNVVRILPPEVVIERYRWEKVVGEFRLAETITHPLHTAPL